MECGEEGQLLPWDVEGAGLMLYGCVFKLQCILGPEKQKFKVTQCGVIHRFFFFVQVPTANASSPNNMLVSCIHVNVSSSVRVVQL